MCSSPSIFSIANKNHILKQIIKSYFTEYLKDTFLLFIWAHIWLICARQVNIEICFSVIVPFVITVFLMRNIIIIIIFFRFPSPFFSCILIRLKIPVKVKYPVLRNDFLFECPFSSFLSFSLCCLYSPSSFL